MTEDEFKEWMVHQGLTASSVSTRISDLRRIEKHFGDLDTAFEKDGCASIFEKLAYTSADEAAGKPNPSGIEIDGNVRDGLSGYKSGLTAYIKFRNDETGSETMSQADRIRKHVANAYAAPARQRGENQFTVVSGDVHRDLRLVNAMPAVCSALDSRKFAELIDGGLTGRAGPANSSTVRFTFELNDSGKFDIAAAERELQRRYGEPLPTNKSTGNQYIVSFALADGRQIALEREGQTVRIWIEGGKDNPPPAGSSEFYAAGQGRQANLPGRLKHIPPSGVQPREVIKIMFPDRQGFNRTLDWYDAKGTSAGALTRAAVIAAMNECAELGIDQFLDKHSFRVPRTYWIAEGGKFYPCKAIANVALRAVEGANTSIRDATRSREIISRLGFRVVDSLEDAPGVRLDLAELERLKQRFLASCSGFEPEGFAGQCPTLLEVLNYEGDSSEKAKAALAASSSGNEAALGGALLDILFKTSLLDRRSRAHVKDVRNRHPGQLEQAAAKLARAKEAPEIAVSQMASSIWPIVSEDQASPPYRISRSFPSMLLALIRRNDAIGINSERFWKTYKTLVGEVPWGDNPLQSDEYSAALSLADALFAIFEAWGWQPRDLWDVRAFIWIVNISPDHQGSDNSSEMDKARPMPRPTNLILYGPPGTGKTYSTVQEAVALCDGSAPEDPFECRARYETLMEAGQIGFVTFHQSYAYEDFVEGLRPETGGGEAESEGSSAGFRLEPRHGIFREICAIAQDARKHVRRGGGFDLQGRKFFKMSLGRAGSEDYIYDQAIDGSYVVLGWGGEVDWSDPRFENWEQMVGRWREEDPAATGQDPNVVQMWPFRSMAVGDLVIVSSGNRHFRAIGEIVGPYEFSPTDVREYNHRRAVRWLMVADDPLPVEMIYDKNFMMQSCYVLNSTRIKHEALSRLLPGDAPAPEAAPDQFVLIIDEINRANISKVFGELITLIEDDKRIGGKNPATVRLPYSGDPFGVPDNLHIIGTMNTADRSIALLDTALRRRFTFRELMPEPKLLQAAAQRTGVPLVALLRRLNERIEYLFDREHQIGHAYFINCETIDAVHETMRHRVIPLLAEYFYEDWHKVALVLGDADGAGRFLTRTQLPPPAGMQADGFSEERWRWQVRDHFDDDAYDTFA